MLFSSRQKHYRYNKKKLMPPFSFSKHKIHVNPVIMKFAVLCCLLFVLVQCWNYGNNEEYVPISKVIENDIEMEQYFPRLAISEIDQRIEYTNATEIDLSKQQDVLMIEEEGTYILSGIFDGSVHVNAKEQIVHLILDQVEISAKEGPAVLIEDAGKVIITLAEGSQNIISDSTDYHSFENQESCIYSNCDLTFNGTGSLEVTSVYKDAIRSKDVLKVLGGDYRIKCKRTGFHGNDGINVTDGSIFIGSEKNGFRTTKTGSDGRGNLVISGGNISVVAGRYAFVTERARLYIYNCNVQLKSVVSDFNVKGGKAVQAGCIQ